MLKELSVKEALLLIAEKYPEPVELHILSKFNSRLGEPERHMLSTDTVHMLNHWRFAIEIPDECRYMTQQECIDWLCLNVYKGYQVRNKGKNGWLPVWFLNVPSNPELYEYRTIQEIDGKVVYGEPMEFLVKVGE